MVGPRAKSTITGGWWHENVWKPLVWTVLQVRGQRNHSSGGREPLHQRWEYWDQGAQSDHFKKTIRKIIHRRLGKLLTGDPDSLSVCLSVRSAICQNIDHMARPYYLNDSLCFHTERVYLYLMRAHPGGNHLFFFIWLWSASAPASKTLAHTWETRLDVCCCVTMGCCMARPGAGYVLETRPDAQSIQLFYLLAILSREKAP